MEATLSAWVQATRSSEDTEAVAVDGKTVCGARTDTQAAPHLLAFCTHETQETLLHVRVSDKTNEIPVAQAAATRLTWHGRVLTADALHTQTALIATMRALGGDVVLTVKDNQPTLAADLALFFADLPTPARHAQTVDRRRGRQEIRDLWVSSDLSTYLATHSRWPGIALVGCLRRRVTVTATGATREETVYLITTLSAAQASPERLLLLVRGHWHIETYRESSPLCARRDLWRGLFTPALGQRAADSCRLAQSGDDPHPSLWLQ